MKNKLFSIFMALVLVLCMMPASVFAEGNDDQDYELRIVDFEGSYWDALIDDPQYGGPLLYGESGQGMDEDPYTWEDENTGLKHTLPECSSYGAKYCYWSYGEAISHYASGAISEHGGYEDQLTVYKQGEDNLVTEGGGHNGSNNFVVHYGYADTSGYGLGESNLPRLTFTNGPHVIDHMYIKLTDYLLNCITNGNNLTAAMGDDDILYVRAIGYDEQNRKVKETKMNVCEGQNLLVQDWTKWDLSSLGEVSSVALEINGSSDNGYGFSQPAYFAFDDVAVRMPKSSEPEENNNQIQVNENGTATIDITGADVDSVEKNGTTYNVVLKEGTPSDAKVSVKFTADSDATGNMAVKYSTSDVAAPGNPQLIPRVFNGIASTNDYEQNLENGKGTLSVYCYNTVQSLANEDYKIKHTINFSIAGAASCSHENTKTDYEAISGQEKHKVTVTCKDCEESLSESEEDCVDENKDGKCDKCEGDVRVPAWHESLFKINGIGYSVEEKKLTDDPIDSQFAGTYRVHLDIDQLKTADWEITMPNGDPIGYANPYSSQSWDGSTSYTVRQSWKSKTLAAQIKNSFNSEYRYLIAPQSLAAPSKATLGNYKDYILVCFDDKYIDESKHEVNIAASNVKANVQQKKTALANSNDILTPEALDTLFGTTDPYYHYNNTSGYTHTWTYTTGTGTNVVTHTIPEEGISYEEIQKLIKSDVFSVKLTNHAVPYRFIVDWNGGDRSDAVPTWFAGKVGDFDADYWKNDLTAEQYDKYKDCYFGYYNVAGMAYVWYDKKTDTVYTEKNKSANSELVGVIKHEDAEDEDFIAYLPRPFAEGAICSGWNLTYLNDRAKCAGDTKTRQEALGNGQPQQIRQSTSSTPIYGDIVVSAQYDSEGAVVFALPKSNDVYAISADHNNVKIVGQPLKNDEQIQSFTKVEKKYDDNYNYFAVLDTEYQDIWLNKINPYYIADTNKVVYVETAEGKTYLADMGSTYATNGSPRYHLTKAANGKDPLPAFAEAASASEDKVVYVHVDEDVIKPANVKVGLQVYNIMDTGRAKQKGTGTEFRYCDFTKDITSQGYALEFYDADGNKVDTDTYDWGTPVRFKIVKNGRDYSSRLKVYKAISPVYVIDGLEGFNVGHTVAVEKDYTYDDMGKSVMAKTTLYCDNELTPDEDGFYTYKLDRIFDIPVSAKKVEDVYLRAVPNPVDDANAKKVEEMIANLGEIDITSKQDIKSVREAFDELYEEEQELVENYEDLKTAEHTYKVKMDQHIAEGHNYTKDVTPASLETDGRVVTSCICGHVESDVVISKIENVRLVKSSVTFTGKEIKPAAVVKDSEGNTIDPKFYTVTYKANKNVGKAKAIITFKGNYEGKVTKTFKIVPKKAGVKYVTRGKGKLTVTMSTSAADKGGNRYQIAYKQKGAKTWKYKTTKYRKATIKKLKKGKRYYVKVRAYRIVNHVKYSGSWSKVKLSRTIR